MEIKDKLLGLYDELIESLPEDDEEKRLYNFLSKYQYEYIDRIHEGLDYLAVACCDLGVLFSKFQNEQQYEVVVQRMAIGYLFEVYNSLSKWIAEPIKEVCIAKNIKYDDFSSCKKTLDSKINKFLPLLKAIRDNSFHSKKCGDKKWVDLATRLMFKNNVPQAIRHYLFEYGYNINVAVYKNNIYGCYPGISGFGAVHPLKGVLPIEDYYLVGTDIKFRPEKVTI